MGQSVGFVRQRFSRQNENERLVFINRIPVVPWNGWDILKAVTLIIGLTLALGNLKGMIIASTLFALAHFDLDLMPPFFVSGMLIA